MASIRLHKVNELFKREISRIIQRDLGNPRVGFTTVTNVQVSADLKHADVRVSVMGEAQQRTTTVAELNKSAGYIQHLLGGRITIRSMPRLRFKLDQSLDAVYRVEELLDDIREDDQLLNGADTGDNDETTSADESDETASADDGPDE